MCYNGEQSGNAVNLSLMLEYIEIIFNVLSFSLYALCNEVSSQNACQIYGKLIVSCFPRY